MIRPPSNQRTYDEFWSGDEAFLQPPTKPAAGADDAELAAHAEQLEAHERKVKVARETADWAPLIIEGGEPTRFELRVLPGDVFRRIVDMWQGNDIGSAEANLLLLRAALVGVVNLGKASVTLAPDRQYPRLGPIADVSVPNLLDRVNPGIVAELATSIRTRAMGVSPL